MTRIRCSRCGSTAEGLDKAPLPGAPGRRVLEQTCPACWEEWKGVQVRLINERRLNLVNPEHYRELLRAMATFLDLHEEEPTDG